MPRFNSAVRHQRQSSDNFLLDAASDGKWFHSSGFAQEFGTRSSSLRKNDDDRVLTSGLLDLHSFDTELLPEVYDVQNEYLTGGNFDDSESILFGNKHVQRSRGLPESHVLRSVSTDKDRANNVAKIKVVVRKRPLNKKEIAKKRGRHYYHRFKFSQFMKENSRCYFVLYCLCYFVVISFMWIRTIMCGIHGSI